MKKLIKALNKTEEVVLVAMFALMALGGDIGCLVGPALVGKIADMFGGDIRISFIFSLAFPAIMIVSLILLRHGDKMRKKRYNMSQ